ncbi:MAG: IS256 family transposase [Elusimicrobiota bacterium]
MSSLAQLYLNDKDLSVRWSNITEDFTGELKKEAQIALRKLITTSTEIQVQDLIGSDKWQHNYQRTVYRHGYRSRGLLTSFGYLANIRVPRISSGKLSFKCFKAYKQRAFDVDELVLKMFLAGVSTRRVKEVLEPLLGYNCISASSVSEITKSLNAQVDKYHARRLVDDYIYLIADGVYFNVKNPVWKKRRCVLVVYGIKANGIRELIDFELASNGESQIAWERFLNRLYHRGLEGKNLNLVVRDGNKGLKNALNNVFLNVLQQPCWAHKLRNVANKVSKKLQPLCLSQARDIYLASDHRAALRIFKSWAKTWQPIAPEAVACLNEDIFDLLSFFKEPEHLWRKLRTSNIIERCFREVRRRTRPMSCFQNSDSIQRIIYAIFFRQNNIWENKPIKLPRNS